jgi:diaminohydroxyphosphoribosylaminopyrimidine deaminase/5-amino-6-(5-phosphoribosylamino)uracil reductase
MPENRDELMMRRAVRLARRGFPAPNPHVGCVLVRDGEVVGEGWHRFAGGDHAEAMALKAAGEKARGATAYVTLEPCNHTGRTPACSEALIAAEAARVVVACLDPNPKARGGLQRLREAGKAVETGVCEKEAFDANRRFLTAMAKGRPYVVVKAAMSLDGRIALPNGQSKWITGEKARRAAHRLRAEMGAVLVGRRTVELDDPLLDARIPGVVNQPIPIVLDPKGRLTGTERVLRNNPQALWVTAQTGPRKLAIAVRNGRFDLEQLLRELWAKGVTGLLVEGGALTVAAFVEAGLVDRFELFTAPKVLGDGPAWIEGAAAESIGDCLKTGPLSVTRLGQDLRITCDVRTDAPAGET